jgi:cell division ATPase FtsA
VVSYYLNGYSITNLLNHKGRYIGADVLATFLPQSVVNSLYKVLDICALVPLSLTLEPIAAIEAAVPDGIRLLNLALVDIGAGTSDIAITRRGAIVAYGMVPVAGDEITEAISDKFLIDFNTAESIKRNAVKKKSITIKDITGTKVTISREDLLPVIEENAAKLAEDISREIIGFNGEAPKAVFCVGGGSKTPYIIDALSEELKLEKNRVAVKKRDAILNLESCDKSIDGPEGVTVIGIAMIAFKKIGHDFINVYVNEKEYRLFNSGNLTVCDVLGLIGYNPSAFMGRSGRSVWFNLNGERKRVQGEAAVPPEIYVNDKFSNIESEVKNGDYIKIKDAQNGRDAAPIVENYLAYFETVRYTLNGESQVINPVYTINGKAAGPLERIKEGDAVSIYMENSIDSAAYTNNIDLGGKVIYANGKAASSGHLQKHISYYLRYHNLLQYHLIFFPHS